MIFRVCTVQRQKYVVAAKTFEQFTEKVKSLLGLSLPYQIVLEEDGSIVTDDVITCVLEDNDHLGSLMVLQHGQTWTPANRTEPINVSESQPVPPQPGPSQPAPSPSPSCSSASSSSPAAEPRKLYPVEEVLERYTKGGVNGPQLVKRMQAGGKLERIELIFLVKACCRYLMKAALIMDQPSKQEKTRMAESIIAAFPVLRSDGPNGYELFYDPVARTGFMEGYICQRRSRCPDIVTKTIRQRKRLFMGDSDELFARTIAGLDIPSTFGYNKQTVTTTCAAQPMAASASQHSTYMTGAQHCEVYSDDPEYRKIKSDLENAGLVLRRLVKLTNTVLAEMFQTEADCLVKFRPPGFSLNIQCLYHGTTAPFVQICDESLDERLSRSGRFGRGIYFSDNPQKCCKYARRRKDEPYLLRCKVIMGDVKEYPPGEEDRSLQKEPLKTVKDGKRVYYDSIKGRPRDHDEYVIYDKRRALIEYVIFYSTSSVHSSMNENVLREDRVDVTEGHDQRLMGGEFVNRVDQYDADRHSRNSSPVSGGSSATSGRSTPADSDDGTGDVLPVTYEPVKSVNARQRSKPVLTQSDTVPVAGNDSSTAAAAAGTTATASSAAGPATAASSAVSKVLSSEVYTAPQLVALRYLIDMKGRLPPDQLESLTREYHRTYGSAASNYQDMTSAASSTEPDPVLEVMSKLINEFKDVTQCNDVEVCRKYIELGQMDLNRAVEAYIDAMS